MDADSVDPRRPPPRGAIFDRLIPRELLDSDPETARRARLGVSLAAALVPLSLVVWIYLSWGLGAPELGRTLGGATLLGLFSLAILWGTRRVGPAAFFVGLVLYGVQTVLAAQLGGLNVTVLVWSFAFPILSALFRAKWRVYLWIGLVLAQILGLHVAQSRGWLGPPSPYSPAADLFSLLAFLAFVSGFLIFSLRLWQRKEEERRRLEGQVAVMEKMDSLGRFAGGMAHDFNNLLMVIQNSAELGLNVLPPDSAVRLELDAIRSAADRGAELTRQILLFSRKGSGMEKEILNLNHVAAGVFGLVRGLLPENIEISFHLSPEPLYIRGVRGQIERVLMNLAANARDAMNGGGRLSLHTEVEKLDAEAELPPGTYASLRMEDTGSGIAPEDLPRIFEPFYTSKARGQGTGLGLSVVYGIVADAGGTIRVDSAPGRGSRFSVLLPLSEAPRNPLPNPGTPAPILLAPQATILVVEDQESVLHVTTRALLSMGYTVLPARDAQQALLIWEQHREKIDLLLSDVLMPLQSGPELARLLLADRPDLKVVFMSGYTDDLLGADDLKENVRFISKPFKPSELIHRVEELLHAGGPSEGRVGTG